MLALFWHMPEEAVLSVSYKLVWSSMDNHADSLRRALKGRRVDLGTPQPQKAIGSCLRQNRGVLTQIKSVLFGNLYTVSVVTTCFNHNKKKTNLFLVFLKSMGFLGYILCIVEWSCFIFPLCMIQLDSSVFQSVDFQICNLLLSKFEVKLTNKSLKSDMELDKLTRASSCQHQGVSLR